MKVVPTELHLSTRANTQDCRSQMPKTCYCGIKSSRWIHKYAMIMPLLVYIFVKSMREGAWLLYIFFYNQNYLGGTSKFIYKASILDNKQIFSIMIDCEATQVPYNTRITFLTDSYIFYQTSQPFSRHTFHCHLLATSMYQQHNCLILLKLEQSTFTQASFSSLSDIHKC